jgi:hypothetical protein
MGSKVMVNNIPMSVIYTGMSPDRLTRLNIMLDAAYDNAMNVWQAENEGWPDDEALRPLAEAEFRRMCNRAAKKAEWNNKPNNTVKKIIRIKKNGKVGK